MKISNINRAADILLESRIKLNRIENLPSKCTPVNKEEAYEIQSIYESNTKYDHIDCIKVDKFQQLDQLIKTSSIKDLIKNNNISDANKYLYGNYKLHGNVEEGYKIGRTLGFPTANINAYKEQIIPSNGVYSVNLLVDKKVYKAICNIGVSPTLHHSDKMKK